MVMTIFGIRVYLYASSFPDLLTTDISRMELELDAPLPPSAAHALLVLAK